MGVWEVLILIAVVVAGIVRSANKNANAQKKPVQRPVFFPSDDDTPQHRERMPEPEYITLEHYGDEEQEAMTLIERRRRETAQRETYSAENKINKLRQEPVTAMDDTLHDETGSGGVIDDFDLRKAILYSEILKPKFEE